MRLDRKKLLHLRAKRGRDGWTQKQAARAAGVSLPTYVNAENGKDLHLIKANRIAKAYHVELEDLEAEAVAEEQTA